MSRHKTKPHTYEVTAKLESRGGRGPIAYHTVISATDDAQAVGIAQEKMRGALEHYDLVKGTIEKMERVTPFARQDIDHKGAGEVGKEEGARYNRTMEIGRELIASNADLLKRLAKR